MNPMYVILISVAGLVIISMWLLAKCVKLHLDKKREEILEDLGFVKDGLAEIVRKGKEVEDLCERLKGYCNAPGILDINDVEFTTDPAPAIFPEANSPESIESPSDPAPAARLSFEDMEAAFETGAFAESYRTDYLYHPDRKFKAKEGKCVMVRPKYHQLIQDILYLAKTECNTISGFIDNVLSEHFAKNAVNIDEILNPSKKTP